MKNLFYSLLIATSLVATACTSNQEADIVPVDPSNKTVISFVAENNNKPVTRAGFGDPTKIAMHIRSNEIGTTNVKETSTLVNAQAEVEKAGFSNIVLDEAYLRYWDDAHGRKSQLSVFAIAVPGESSPTNNGETNTLEKILGTSSDWNSTLDEKIDWYLSTEQTSDDILDSEDLVYSNNIQGDNKLIFRLTDSEQTNGPGTFDQGKLDFYHALSRITVNIVKGTGYGDDSFNFPKDSEGNITSNVTILGLPTSGTFDIESGSWTSTNSSNITKMVPQNIPDNADYKYSFMAQVLPGYSFNKDNTTNVLEFIIDDNKYFVTQKMMLAALNGTSGTASSINMEQGKNYVFKITVNKSKIINVTATLEPWKNVTADNQNMDNSHITLDLFTSNGEAGKDFDLYRLNDASSEISTDPSKSTNWGGNYTSENKARLNYNDTKKKWETEWFFDDNKSFYHFRTVDKDKKIEENDSDKDDYFEITSGAQDDDHNHWGAPFKKNGTDSPIIYDTTNGYTKYLSPAIGATNYDISITELHMLSNINVVLRTTKTADAITLEDADENQCEVYLTYFYEKGQVKMGNGLVTPITTDGLKESASFTKASKGIDDTDETYKSTNAFTFAVVPQALVRTSVTNAYVGITIKTPDNNQYYVVEKLSDIIASANGGSKNQTTSEKIEFWFPNHSYTYTFTLTKTGIKNITCTVNDWTKVTATNQNISLED